MKIEDYTLLYKEKRVTETKALFREKKKKTPTSQLGGLLLKAFMMEFQIS